MTLARTHQGDLARLQTTTGEEIAVADRVFSYFEDEYARLRGRRKSLEAKHPWLLDAENRPDPVPKGVIGTYEAVVREMAELRKDILNYPAQKQAVLEKQLTTRQKSGELILADTVAVFLVQITTKARKYVAPQFARAFEDDAKAVYDEFIRRNPGAQYADGGRLREDESRTIG